MRYLALLGCMSFLAGGCGLAGVVGSPTGYEQKVPAEFDLVNATQGRVAVLVRGGPDTTAREVLGLASTARLASLPKMRKNRIVPYEEVMQLRVEDERFYSLTPRQVGEALDAETVLVVKILNYGLYPVPVGGYYDVLLVAEAVLLDTASGEQLWPVYENAKRLRLAAETQRGSADQVTVQFLSRAAHGFARYLYDCPKLHFMMHGEQRDYQWDSW